MKKGDKIVMVITTPAFDRWPITETASIQVVSKVTKKRVNVEDHPSIHFDAESLREIDPPIPGCSSRLIELEE